MKKNGNLPLVAIHDQIGCWYKASVPSVKESSPTNTKLWNASWIIWH